MNATTLLQEEAERTKTIIEDLNSLSNFSENQLRWKPSKKKWSIIECIEHINTACRHYIPEMNRQVMTAPKSEGESHFRAGLLGNYLSKMMEPQENGQISGKMKTLSKFQPQLKSGSGDSKAVFDECIDHHRKLLDLTDHAKNVNINKVKVTSALGPIIRFKLGDCFRFNTAHHRRHILQAQKLTKLEGFPTQ